VLVFLRRLGCSLCRVDALDGRRVRIRGVVLEGRQLTIDVAVPEQIERLD
jgi:hypothetical protein